MKISNRFAIGIHILLVIAYLKNDEKISCTSEYIAESVNINPVIIRKVIAKLKAAGLIVVKSGSGGAFLTGEPEDISLLDVYRAVEVVKDDELFNLHNKPNPNCPIGKNINPVLDIVLTKASKAMEEVLKSVSIEQVLEDIRT